MGFNSAFEGLITNLATTSVTAIPFIKKFYKNLLFSIQFIQSCFLHLGPRSFYSGNTGKRTVCPAIKKITVFSGGANIKTPNIDILISSL